MGVPMIIDTDIDSIRSWYNGTYLVREEKRQVCRVLNIHDPEVEDYYDEDLDEHIPGDPDMGNLHVYAQVFDGNEITECNIPVEELTVKFIPPFYAANGDYVGAQVHRSYKRAISTHSLGLSDYWDQLFGDCSKMPPLGPDYFVAKSSLYLNNYFVDALYYRGVAVGIARDNKILTTDLHKERLSLIMIEKETGYELL